MPINDAQAQKILVERQKFRTIAVFAGAVLVLCLAFLFPFLYMKPNKTGTNWTNLQNHDEVNRTQSGNEQANHSSKMSFSIHNDDNRIQSGNEQANHSSKMSSIQKRVVVIGTTGSGKSALCNILSGDKGKSKFPESASADSKTHKITVTHLKWLGDGTEITLIDTPGLGDSKGKDDDNVMKMIEELKKIEEIHAFVIVFNGQNARFDEHLQGMMRMFGGMFGLEYLKNTVLVFTRWGFDQRSIESRRSNNDTEQNKEIEYSTHINNLFKTKFSIPCIFTDNYYNNDKNFAPEEYKMFKNNLDKLKNLIDSFAPFECKDFKAQKKEISTLKQTNQDLQKANQDLQKDLDQKKAAEIWKNGLTGDRKHFTKKTVSMLEEIYPSYHVLVIDNKWSHSLDLQDIIHETHYELPFGIPQTHGFDVYVFKKGRVKKGGDGGRLNWSHSDLDGETKYVINHTDYDVQFYSKP